MNWTSHHCLLPDRYHPYIEACWWEHHAVGMFFSSRICETSQSRLKNKCSEEETFLMHFPLWIQDWGEGSSSNKTTLWRLSKTTPLLYPGVSQPETRLEPDWTCLERFENGCALMLPIHPNGGWEVLQRRMRKMKTTPKCQYGIFCVEFWDEKAVTWQTVEQV